MMDRKGIGIAARPDSGVAHDERFRRDDWRGAVGVVRLRRRWTVRRRGLECPRAPAKFFLGRWAKCGLVAILLASLAGGAQYFGARARLAHAADSIRKCLQPGERINEQIHTK